MPRYRVCKSFTVESGHMLSKHPERCRFPHGHTRKIEVVVSSEQLDARDMVVDFKALKLALREHIDRYDHAMAINTADPAFGELSARYPMGVVAFENVDPTTEVLAKEIYDFLAGLVATGFVGKSSTGIDYAIPGAGIHVERVRVWETTSSWAEYGD